MEGQGRGADAGRGEPGPGEASRDRGGTPGDTKRRRNTIAVGLLIALLLQTAFAVAYVGALHDPRPSGVPIGVLDAGTGAAVARAGRGALSPRLEPSAAAIQRGLQRRELAGAVAGDTLYVASAASYSTARFLTAAFATARPELRVVDVAPLPPGDSTGLTLFYAVIAWSFGGYFAATVVTALVGAASRTHRAAAGRMGALAAFSVLAGLVGALIVDQAFGAVEGHFLTLAGIGMLISFAVAAATAALQSLLGVIGTLVVLVTFVMFGNASAGGAYQRTFLPGFWEAIGSWLPAGAGVEALRGAIYFGGENITGRLLVLAAYAVVGTAVTIGLGWRRGLRAPELELATAAAA